jgi:AraC-like DNA-binding protein
MTVSIMCVRGIVAEVARLGFSPEPLLRTAGISDESLSDTRMKVPITQFQALVGQAIELTSCPSLGLSVGSAGPEFQLVAQFARALPTLRDAVHMLVRYTPIFVDGMVMELVDTRPLASMRYEFRPDLDERTERFCAELFSALCTRVSAETYTAGAPSVELHFTHEEPPHAERYWQVFRCASRFAQPENAIFFEAALLDRTQAHADAFMADLLGQACERMLASTKQGSTLEERVRLFLRDQPALCNVESETIARELGIGARMLRRHLAREGVTVSGLIEQARIEASASELLRADASIKEVAGKLGYSDVSAFHRAFKRWMGQTPGEYVRAQRGRG